MRCVLLGLLLTSCTIESLSFGETPEPAIIAVSPQVAAPGQRIIIVGQNFELTPEDPNDLPGSERPTPYSIEVFIGEQLIPFQSGDSITSGFLTVVLPSLLPGQYEAHVVVNGKPSNSILLLVDTITSLTFSPDPITLSTVGESTRVTVLGNRFDGAQIDVTDEVTFEVDPPNALSFGFTHFMAGLQSGDFTLTARKGFLSDSITVRVLAGDPIVSLSAPEVITLAIGDEHILTLDGLTAFGESIALEAVSSLQTTGDELAIPIERNELGQPVLTALQPSNATITFSIADGSLGSVSSQVIVQP
jgi:IPT/TIG domain